VSTARHAIDSTFRRVLSYAAEIIISIILLVIICIPLVFALPMWLEHVLFGVPRTELSINLVAWFGYDGTLWLTLLLGLVSVSLGYLYILKMKPGSTSADTDEEERGLEHPEEEYETAASGEIETAEVASEDQEEAKETLDLDEIEESLEDIEEEEEELEEDD
jgi:Ca2+/Na+ antiporter